MRTETIPEQRRRPALVCAVEGCTSGITTEGTDDWPETIGIRVEGFRCSAHPDTPPVRGYLDDRNLWR